MWQNVLDVLEVDIRIRAGPSSCGAQCKNLARGPTVAVLCCHRPQSTGLRLLWLRYFSKITIWISKKTAHFWSSSVWTWQHNSFFYLEERKLGIAQVLPVTSMFMTNSMLLWWTLEVYRNQEVRAASVSAKLRRSNRTDKRIELTMQSLHSCWTARSFEEQLI